PPHTLPRLLGDEDHADGAKRCNRPPSHGCARFQWLLALWPAHPCRRPAPVFAHAAAPYKGAAPRPALRGSEIDFETIGQGRRYHVPFRAPESVPAAAVGGTYCAPPSIVGNPSCQIPPR